MYVLRFILITLLLCGLCAVSRAATRPGDFVPGFGSNNYVRIGWNRSGESQFDSARFVKVRYEGTGPIRTLYIYVAGITGDRVGIAKLDGNGVPVASFGTNGYVTSTQYGINALAGLEFAPNGDVVLGYSVWNVDDGVVHGQGEDVFVEVFTSIGQPRTQQNVFQFGVLIPVNWVGVDTQRYISAGNLCSNTYFTRFATAYSMAQSPGGNLAVAGVSDWIPTPEGNDEGYNARQLTTTARFFFDAGAGVYRRSGTDNAHECSNTGTFKYSVHGDSGGANARSFAQASVYLSDSDLRVAGSVYNFDFGHPTFPRYGGYHALPANPNTTTSVLAGSAWLAGGYWGREVRQSSFQSMQWVPGLPRLFLYGDAEDAFYAQGNRTSPIIGFDNGSNVLSPRWAFLPGTMDVYSAAVRKGLYRNGKHILLGATRLCAAINDCAGAWDGWFLLRTQGEPGPLSYSLDAGFADNGARAYRVVGNNGIPAPRAFAFDAAVVEPRGQVPGQESTADLIVVGDFRYFETGDASDYDWFVARIRLRGSNGGLGVDLAGSGSGSVSSSPAGIACPGTCSAAFIADTQVTLTATPTAGSSFAGWAPGSACESISANRCTVYIDGARNVTAQFTLGGSGPLFADGFESP